MCVCVVLDEVSFHVSVLLAYISLYHACASEGRKRTFDPLELKYRLELHGEPSCECWELIWGPLDFMTLF